MAKISSSSSLGRTSSVEGGKTWFRKHSLIAKLREGTKKRLTVEVKMNTEIELEGREGEGGGKGREVRICI